MLTAIHGAIASSRSTGGTAWDVSAFTYDSVSKSTGAQDSNSRGIEFGDSGTKMYLSGGLNSSIYQYTLSTPWDLNTLTYAIKLKNVSAELAIPRSSRLKSDGLTMYVAASTGVIYQYTLGTAWDVSTASYASKSADVSPQVGSLEDLFLSSDGTKLYATSSTDFIAYQYTLGTAWDISTASYASKSFDFNTQEAGRGIFFKPDGLSMFGVGILNDSVWQYTLGTAWDISTASYASKFKDVGTEAVQPTDVSFSDDGTTMYVFNQFNNTIYQYSI